MHRHRHRPRRRERHPELFPAAAQPPMPHAVPGWDGLPEQARRAVTTLMTRLLVAHAGGTALKAKDGADER